MRDRDTRHSEKFGHDDGHWDEIIGTRWSWAHTVAVTGKLGLPSCIWSIRSNPFPRVVVPVKKYKIRLSATKFEETGSRRFIFYSFEHCGSSVVDHAVLEKTKKNGFSGPFYCM